MQKTYLGWIRVNLVAGLFSGSGLQCCPPASPSAPLLWRLAAQGYFLSPQVWPFDDGTWARSPLSSQKCSTTLQDEGHPLSLLGILELLASPTELMSPAEAWLLPGLVRQAPVMSSRPDREHWELPWVCAWLLQGGVIRPSIWLLHGWHWGLGAAEDPPFHPQS